MSEFGMALSCKPRRLVADNPSPSETSLVIHCPSVASPITVKSSVAFSSRDVCMCLDLRIFNISLLLFN